MSLILGCFILFEILPCVDFADNCIDYLHITKRFGIVAASQFPVHYMLSMKGRFSPFAIAFSASHEQLNPWHRISGRIIYSLLFLHASWYMNFFVRAGVLKLRMTSLVPLLGVGAFSLLTILVTSALARVRRWNYRVFFTLHLVIGVVILPVLFFHAAPLRLYTAECLALFVLDLIARKLDTIQGFAIITPIHGTNLLKIVIPIPQSKAKRFLSAPGQHVYLNLPHASTPHSTILSIHDILHNPFTVADVTTNSITLVLRSLHGPTTKALKLLEKLPKAKPPINIEGPYGSVKSFPNLISDFDRVLLVAGGVGASFIVPIYRDIVSAVTDDGVGSTKVEFIWSMRSAAESAWTNTNTTHQSVFANDDRVKIYVTGVRADDLDSSLAHPGAEDGSLEMEDLSKDEQQNVLATSGRGTGAPDLGSIVDKTFRYGENERVAVLVCGPTGMAEELRGHVGRWVGKGRYVWWHDETFGW